jgi:aminoglycoside 3-N-acetyltransferase
MLSYRDIVTGLRKLDIDRSRPVITHTSLSAFGKIHGGPDTLLAALLSSFSSVIMPAFTYKTMIIPEVGQPDNAMVYGSGKDTNRMAEIYQPAMPADKMMGTLAESLRAHPEAGRSAHPILSFAGINTEKILNSQTIKEPLLPFKMLRDMAGWVLLYGVGQTVNTGIHYGEKLVGRKQFMRWALTSKGVISCPSFPGCSNGFEALTPRLEQVIRKVAVGEGVIQAMPVVDMIDTVCAMIKDDPIALLCAREDCERCNAVRVSVSKL